MRVSRHYDQVLKSHHHYRRHSDEFRQNQNHSEIKNLKNDQERSSISELRQLLSTLYSQVF